MAKAYLRVFVERAHEERVRNRLLGVEGVKTADLTTGEQDIIALVEAETFDDVIQIILGQIRCIEGIQRTITSLAL